MTNLECSREVNAAKRVQVREMNSSPISVTFDHQIFTTQCVGGVSRYFVELATHLGDLPDVRARVVAPLYASRLLRASEAVHRLGWYLPGPIPKVHRAVYFANAVLCRALVHGMASDIVHETYYSRIGSNPRRTKVVLTVFDMIHEKFPASFRNPKDMYELKRAALSRADHVICISESTRNDLLELHKLDAARVSVVYLASSMSTAGTAKPSERTRPYILYVGTRHGYKNYLRLVEAFGKSNLHRSHDLVCFGGGPVTRVEAEAMASHSVPAASVHFVGGDDDLLSRYYAGADAFVYPSLYEGFGIPFSRPCSVIVLSRAATRVLYRKLPVTLLNISIRQMSRVLLSPCSGPSRVAVAGLS